MFSLTFFLKIVWDSKVGKQISPLFVFPGFEAFLTFHIRRQLVIVELPRHNRIYLEVPLNFV